jgi:cytochrome c oxidase cbb3-type subunit 2/cytochrome c oxidase cbb3-type subunit I/II
MDQVTIHAMRTLTRGRAPGLVVIAALTVASLLNGWHAAVAASDPVRGKVIYEKNCQGCHGKTGAGVGGATPNLTDSKRMSGVTDQYLFDVVTQGRPGTGMPGWGATLSEQDRWNVVGYLRTLAKP